jgi:hypothetical protein
VVRPSRLALDGGSHLPTVNSFDEFSQFLQGASADADSRRLTEGMGQLARRIEAIVAGLREGRQRSTVAPLLVDLLTVLRAHRREIVNLGLPWRGLYEYAGYLQALTNFRVLIGQWLLDGGPRSEQLLLTAEDFELIAWRTVGEGMLLIDMYEDWVAHDEPEESGLGALPEPQVQRAIHWWQKLRR